MSIDFAPATVKLYHMKGAGNRADWRRWVLVLWRKTERERGIERIWRAEDGLVLGSQMSLNTAPRQQ
jgi:hypothetical protein